MVETSNKPHLYSAAAETVLSRVPPEPVDHLGTLTRARVQEALHPRSLITTGAVVGHNNSGLVT